MKHDDKQYWIGKTMENADVLADFVYLSHDQKFSALHSLLIELEEDQKKTRDFVVKMAEYMSKMMRQIEAIEKHLGAKSNG